MHHMAQLIRYSMSQAISIVIVIYRQYTECCRRLADALDGGVANVATKHAVEALHHLAVQLPTCRDLILATTALDMLVLLLKQSLANAHYSMLKVMLFS